MAHIQDQSQLNEFYSFCNTKNTTDALDIDIVDPSKFELWKYYNIQQTVYQDETHPIKLYGEEINYSLFKYSNDNPVKRELIVIPGFSKKSICWTIGRINHFLDKLKSDFSDIVIFNLEDLKEKYTKITDNGVPKYDILTKIGYQLNKIVKHMGFKNISLLGRSAGGALAIVIATLNTDVKGLNLACPGFEDRMIVDLIATERNIPIRIGWAKEDTKIPITKGYKLKEMLEFSEKNVEMYEISTGSSEDKVNHRIHQISIDNLV
ncbi:hypothetical protein CPAV1605_968 [seawater metagenome]|uniref:Alpha/beta hydrolase n=1 Tax=seawater metagenome TaxID=1561972 RepID=A0A5E8CIN1_9ZZZZ